MPENLPEKTLTTVNDLYLSESSGNPSVWEKVAPVENSYLAPSGEEINYVRFLNNFNEYGKGEVFGIGEYLKEILTKDENGKRKDFATTECSDQDVLFMINRINELYPEEPFEKVENYALSRPFIISTFNVLRLIPSLLYYSSYGKEAEKVLKLGLDQLMAKTDIELFWREEAKSKEGKVLYRTNEGFQRMQGNNPNSSGKITEKEMGRIVLPNVIRIVKRVSETRSVFI